MSTKIILFVDGCSSPNPPHRRFLAEREREPHCVAVVAKGFIQKHAMDQLTVENVARHVYT